MEFRNINKKFKLRKDNKIMNSFANIGITFHRLFELLSIITLSLSINLLSTHISDLKLCSQLSISIFLLVFSGILGFLVSGFISNSESTAKAEFYIANGTGETIRKRTITEMTNNIYFKFFCIGEVLFFIFIIAGFILL